MAVMTASSRVASESSLASDSTMRTASPCRRRQVEAESSILDRRIKLQRAIDEADARRADAHEGMPDKVSAAEVATIAKISGRLEVMRKHRDNDLRVIAIAIRKQRTDRRSIRRETSVSFSEGRPSRLK